MSTNNGQLEGPEIDEALSERINEINEELDDGDVHPKDKLELMDELDRLQPIYEQLVAAREQLQNIRGIPRDQAREQVATLTQLEEAALAELSRMMPSKVASAMVGANWPFPTPPVRG